MARHAESWRLVWRRGVARVRFRHEGERVEITTGSRDPGVAAKRAAQIYAEAISGKRHRTGPASTQSLKDIIVEWGTSLDATLDHRTAREYLIYAKAQWLTRWEVLGDVNTKTIADYQRERLRKVTRTTLRKELSAMRGMLRWCVERGIIGEVPEIPTLARNVTGNRAVPIQKRIILTDKEAQRLISVLTEGGHSRNYVEFAWETGLRPATIFRLAYPTHWAPGRETLTLTDDVDKARFARELPLSERAQHILKNCALGRTNRFFRWRNLVEEEIHTASEKHLGRRVGLYDLRHSRITHLVEAGGPLTGVQYLAGHKHLSTTARYAHAGLKAAEAALAALRGPGPHKRTKRAP